MKIRSYTRLVHPLAQFDAVMTLIHAIRAYVVDEWRDYRPEEFTDEEKALDDEEFEEKFVPFKTLLGTIVIALMQTGLRLESDVFDHEDADDNCGEGILSYDESVDDECEGYLRAMSLDFIKTMTTNTKDDAVPLDPRLVERVEALMGFDRLMCVPDYEDTVPMMSKMLTRLALSGSKEAWNYIIDDREVEQIICRHKESS